MAVIYIQCGCIQLYLLYKYSIFENKKNISGIISFELQSAYITRSGMGDSIY